MINAERVEPLVKQLNLITGDEWELNIFTKVGGKNSAEFISKKTGISHKIDSFNHGNDLFDWITGITKFDELSLSIIMAGNNFDHDLTILVDKAPIVWYYSEAIDYSVLVSPPIVFFPHVQKVEVTMAGDNGFDFEISRDGKYSIQMQNTASFDINIGLNRRNYSRVPTFQREIRVREGNEK